jgi:hypothetical protein
MGSFGPYTVVDGKIFWPHHEVEPRTYRLRVLNGSNARTFRLFLIDQDGEPILDRVRQIGSDGGLLLDAVPLPSGGLLLASEPPLWCAFSHGVSRGPATVHGWHSSLPPKPRALCRASSAFEASCTGRVPRRSQAGDSESTSIPTPANL